MGYGSGGPPLLTTQVVHANGDGEWPEKQQGHERWNQTTGAGFAGNRR